MRLQTFAIGGILALAIFLFAQRRPTEEVHPLFKATIDLTHPLNEKTPGYTPDEALHARHVASYDKEGYYARSISLVEHFGTHVDAPAHFAQGRWTIDQVPAERLIRPLIAIDVSSRVKDNADYLVSVEDIADWEDKNGRIPPGAVVMVRTGWDERWNSPERYRGADPKGMLHFPAYSADAAKFLAEGREVVGLGIDTLSVDSGTTSDYLVHRYCSARDIYHIENVANLALVPPVGALVVIAPMKLQGGSGAPARVLALLH
jgi:kynurenine formamidase